MEKVFSLENQHADLRAAGCPRGSVAQVGHELTISVTLRRNKSSLIAWNRRDIHLIDLSRIEEAFRIAEIDLLTDEDVEKIRVDVAIEAKVGQDPDGLGKLHSVLVIYIADEAFFTGTAAEVTPIRELDGRRIGEGRRGPVTTRIQSLFFDVVNGKVPAHAEWLTPV